MVDALNKRIVEICFSKAIFHDIMSAKLKLGGGAFANPNAGSKKVSVWDQVHLRTFVFFVRKIFLNSYRQTKKKKREVQVFFKVQI